MPKKQNKATKPTKATKSAVTKSAAKEMLAGYEDFLRDLKTQIRSTQIKASIAVNTELISLYWEIGKGIVERQETAGWGDEVVDRLSHDLVHEFPAMK